MKTVNSFPESSYEGLAAQDICKIIEKATQEGVSSHHEVLHLAKLILKLDPQDIDASMQAKFNQLMGKVRTQFA